MEKKTISKLGIALVFFTLTGCGAGETQVKMNQEESPSRSPSLKNPLPRVSANLRNTHYYTIFENDYVGTPNVPVIGLSGETLTLVSSAFYKDLQMEGSGKLRDGRVLNYSTSAGGVHRYVFSKNTWGNGVGNCALTPFHTIAVDRRVIPLGSLVYIDETKGMPLPDGTLHDGTWRADDIGSAIQNDRVDLYIGKRSWNTALSKFKIDHLKALTIRILALPDGESCIR